jgi:hypothetical protein
VLEFTYWPHYRFERLLGGANNTRNDVGRQKWIEGRPTTTCLIAEAHAPAESQKS